MKTKVIVKNEHVWYVWSIVIVASLSFLATWFLDRLGIATICLVTGWVVACRLPAPSPMDMSSVHCHARAACLAIPYLVASVAPLFVVSELAKRGIGYALSYCFVSEVSWAAIMVVVFAVGFLDGRVKQKPAF